MGNGEVGSIPFPLPPGQGDTTGRIFIQHQPPPPPGDQGLKLWQLLLSFIGAAAVIVGGVWVIATTIFLDKETYLREQQKQIEINTQLTSTVTGLVKTVEQMQQMQQQAQAARATDSGFSAHPRRQP